MSRSSLPLKSDYANFTTYIIERWALSQRKFHRPAFKRSEHVKQGEKRLRKTGVNSMHPAQQQTTYLSPALKIFFVSGQVPFIGGKLEITGTVGKNATVEDAQGQAKYVRSIC